MPLGIHAHDDLKVGVANSIAAVEAGCVHVQGTFNGLGERCGNADLCAIIGILHTKMKQKSIPDKNISKLTEASYFISEISNFKRHSSGHLYFTLKDRFCNQLLFNTLQPPLLYLCPLFKSINLFHALPDAILMAY